VEKERREKKVWGGRKKKKKGEKVTSASISKFAHWKRCGKKRGGKGISGGRKKKRGENRRAQRRLLSIFNYIVKEKGEKEKGGLKERKKSRRGS